VDGKIQSHVVRYNEILTSVVFLHEARRAGIVREAPASGSLGFRHGLAGDQSQLRDKTIEDSRVCLAASPANRIVNDSGGFPQRQNVKHGTGRASDLRASRAQRR